MAESLYEDHDTQPIQLPRQVGPSQPRETFREKQVVDSVFAAPHRPDLNIFAPLDSRDPGGVKNYEVLRIGDTLYVPELAYDEDGNVIPNAFTMNQYTVEGTGTEDGKLIARIANDTGIEETIPADIMVRGDGKFEAAIARQLLELDGIDIHDPNTQLIDSRDDRGPKA